MIYISLVAHFRLLSKSLSTLTSWERSVVVKEGARNAFAHRLMEWLDVWRWTSPTSPPPQRSESNSAGNATVAPPSFVDLGS